MSRWANMPCTKCAKDTTHYAGKCRECGTLFVSPFQQRAKARARHALYVLAGKTPRHAFRQARNAADPGPIAEFNPTPRSYLKAGRERAKA